MAGGFWPDYRAVWRWHFYAGLLCLPFVVILSITGGVYLFRPQIEAWEERGYEGLRLSGVSVSEAGGGSSIGGAIGAALGAFEGAGFVSCELPRREDSAVRVMVRRGGELLRVYVHPETLEVLGWVREEDRLMRIFFRLHGELLMGDRGSNLVETVACWTIVLLLSGVFLWWPRGQRGLAGVLYPRLGGGRRLFWRDIHAVTGMWLTGFALFLLLTGLPWAKFWGDYFRGVRELTGLSAAKQDWANSSAAKSGGAVGAGGGGAVAGGGGHAGHGSGGGGIRAAALPAREVLDLMAVNVQSLGLEAPVLIAAPGGRTRTWSGKSETQNRPLRVSVELDPKTGAILGREDFSGKHWIDRLVGYGVAAHEGQLFGWLNVLLGLITVTGLLLVTVSAVVMWWRRRSVGALGAPAAISRERASGGLLLSILVLGVCFPLFAASLAVVLLLEWGVLRRVEPVRQWLGLAA
jgi:uncharacterized iron-regulated membrane protein